MTFEEIQQVIQQMLTVQLGTVERLLVQSERQERIMNQLIGYSIRVNPIYGIWKKRSALWV